MSKADARGSVVFGTNLPTSAEPGSDPVDLARRAERLGYDFVSANDHPCGTEPSYETWTMLCWVAAATSRLKVATRVLGVPYRAPAMVAKMAESLARLSRGRLILGLGGGSADHEFRAFGLGVPSPREKVDALEDAVRVIRGLWSERDFTYQGRHHRTEVANIEPKPDRAIPIWLGTFGNRALEVTGRVADGWIPTLSVAPPESIPAMRERIIRSAREAGREPDEMTFVYNVEIYVGRTSDLAPHVLQGRPDQLVDTLAAYMERGFHGLNFTFAAAQHEQMEALARDVLPHLRHKLLK